MYAGFAQSSDALDQLGAQIGSEKSSVQNGSGHAPRVSFGEGWEPRRLQTASAATGARMPRSIVWAIVVLVTAIAIWVLSPFFASSTRAAGPAGLAGTVAPVFELRDDRGAGVSLSDYRGRVVLMNLWASWCPPCRAEMPDLQRLANAYSPSAIAIVGVNEGESPQRARAFATALRISFPIWIDEGQRYGRIYTALGLPTTVILDRRGIVVRGFDGALTYAQMRSAIASLVSSQ